MSIMDMKFNINLSAYGEPVVEQEIDAPWVSKGHREVRINLPLGYERLKYRIFFIDLTSEEAIGPFFSGQVVNLSSFSGRVKIKAILDKEYMVSFRDTIDIPMNASGKYVPLRISYNYEGLLDINFDNIALCRESFSSEASLLLRAKSNMETVLRAIVSQIIDQNRTSDGNIVSSLFYSLETLVNLAIHQNFNEICGGYMSWCKPVNNIKIRNDNMNEIMQVINEPIEIARKRDEEIFVHTKKMQEIALQGSITLQTESIRAVAAIGATGVLEPDQLGALNTSLQTNNGLIDFVNNTGLNLSMNNSGLNLNTNLETPALDYLKRK